MHSEEKQQKQRSINGKCMIILNSILFLKYIDHLYSETIDKYYFKNSL